MPAPKKATVKEIRKRVRQVKKKYPTPRARRREALSERKLNPLNKQKEGKPGPKYKLTVERAAEALIKKRGFVTKAAAYLGVAFKTLRKLIDSNPYLQEVLEATEEKHLDLAESKLMRRVQEGDLTAIIFLLKCKGKKRGYIDKLIEGTGLASQPVQINITPAHEVKVEERGGAKVGEVEKQSK